MHIIGCFLFSISRELIIRESDGLNSAIVHKDIITDEMIDRYWDFIRMDGTREATITRGRIRDKRIRAFVEFEFVS